MPCDRRLKPRQTLSDRKAEISRAIDKISRGLASGRFGVKVSPKGAIAFTNVDAFIRDDVTDACIYRAIARNGSAEARLAIQKAELLAGRGVDKQSIAAGIHSHDDGLSWHDHKG